MAIFRLCPVHWLDPEASAPLDSLMHLQSLSFRCTSWTGSCDCSLLCLNVEYLEPLLGQSLSNCFCRLLASLLSCLPELSRSLTTLMSTVSTWYSVRVVEWPCVALHLWFNLNFWLILCFCIMLQQYWLRQHLCWQAWLYASLWGQDLHRWC